jgi:hypothetical protein
MKRIEVDFSGGLMAAVEDGQWKCTDKALLKLIVSVSDSVDDSPSIPNLDFARAQLAADVLGGKVLTKVPPASTIVGRVY